MPIVDPKTIPIRTGSGYPAPYHEPCMARTALRLSDAGGLTQFGVNKITLAPGAWSSQRHHHSAEDELVYILEGTPSFIDDAGETLLQPGDITTHRAGDGNAHHMINRTGTDVVFLVIGTRNPQQDSGVYPDIDLAIPANGTPSRVFTRKDGSLFED